MFIKVRRISGLAIVFSYVIRILDKIINKDVGYFKNWNVLKPSRSKWHHYQKCIYFKVYTEYLPGYVLLCFVIKTEYIYDHYNCVPGISCP